jgi:hypothetical protein
MLKMAMAAGVALGPSTKLPSLGAPMKGSSGVRSWRARARLSLGFAGPCLAINKKTCDSLERCRPPTREVHLAVVRCDCRVQAAQDTHGVEIADVLKSSTLAWSSTFGRVVNVTKPDGVSVSGRQPIRVQPGANTGSVDAEESVALDRSIPQRHDRFLIATIVIVGHGVGEEGEQPQTQEQE